MGTELVFSPKIILIRKSLVKSTAGEGCDSRSATPLQFEDEEDTDASLCRIMMMMMDPKYK